MLPVLYRSDKTTISIYIQLISINTFDQVSGELDLTVLFQMTWIEERITWDPTTYGGQTSLLVDVTDLWRPQIYIQQSFGTLQNIGNNSHMPRLYYNGTVVWNPGSVIKVGCTVDVTYFPFDTQTCTITFGASHYLNSELELKSMVSHVDTRLFSVNTQWLVNDQSTLTTVAATDRPVPSWINLQLVLERQSVFYVVYIIIPLGLLGVVNNLVFMLPDTSGERMSVTVTVFLSFIVYLQMINANVPESSNPMASLYYYVLFLLVHSSVTLFLCIMSLRIHSRHDAVPQQLQGVVRFLLCGFFWRRKLSPTHSSTILIKETHGMGAEDESLEPRELVENDIDKNLNCRHEITWKNVGDYYDRFFGVGLFLIFVIVTLNSFIRIYTNTGYDTK